MAAEKASAMPHTVIAAIKREKLTIFCSSSRTGSPVWSSKMISVNGALSAQWPEGRTTAHMPQHAWHDIVQTGKNIHCLIKERLDGWQNRMPKAKRSFNGRTTDLHSIFRGDR
jgi:hypothetical protein